MTIEKGRKYNKTFFEEGKRPNCGTEEISELTGWCYNHHNPVVDYNRLFCPVEKGDCAFVVHVNKGWMCEDCQTLFDDEKMFDWSKNDFMQCPVGEEYEEIPENFDIPTDYYANARFNLNDIFGLMYEKIEKEEENTYIAGNRLLIQLIYGNAITVLETYLNDAFIYNIIHNDKYLKTIINKCKPFKNNILPNILAKCNSMCDEDSNSIKDLLKYEVLKELNFISFHNLPKVKYMFKSVYNLDFPKNWETLTDEVKIRHDLFHRNGKDKDGNELELKFKDLETVVKLVEEFIEDIEEKLKILLSDDGK